MHSHPKPRDPADPDHTTLSARVPTTGAAVRSQQYPAGGWREESFQQALDRERRAMEAKQSLRAKEAVAEAGQ